MHVIICMYIYIYFSKLCKITKLQNNLIRYTKYNFIYDPTSIFYVPIIVHLVWNYGNAYALSPKP